MEPRDEATSTLECKRWSLGRKIPASESRSASQPRQPPSLILEDLQHVCAELSSLSDKYAHRLEAWLMGFRSEIFKEISINLEA
jgi:hypothetical protein